MGARVGLKHKFHKYIFERFFKPQKGHKALAGFHPYRAGLPDYSEGIIEIPLETFEALFETFNASPLETLPRTGTPPRQGHQPDERLVSLMRFKESLKK